MFGFGINKRLDNIEEKMFDLERNQLVILGKLVNLQLTIDNMGKELERIRGKRKKPRPPLSQKTGYKAVTPEERKEFYEMYKVGASMTDIAAHFNRSQSCVSKNIQRILEEEQNETTLGETEEKK